MTMKGVQIAELKSRLSEHLRKVRAGRTVTVLDRNTPIARIVPYAESGASLAVRARLAGAPALKDIADACKDLGLQAGFQNHSGRQYVGAPVWDVFSLIGDLDPRHFGFCFDIGHATVEGGLSWPTEARLAEPFYTAVIVKDFYWKKEASGGWKDTWCPLGEGMVNRSFFDWLKKSNYSGPICQHHEYPLGDGGQMLVHLQHDLKVLKEWLG